MKANRKFLMRDEEAVSPVIAVILMVAITVVLAATVYVWVSGFGSNSSQPAKSIAFTSGGTLKTSQDLDAETWDHDSNAGTAEVLRNDDSYKIYIVSAASPGLKYSDLAFTLNGATVAHSTAGCDSDDSDTQLAGATSPEWVVCVSPWATTAPTERATSDLVSAGDHIYVMLEGSSASGQTFRVLDSAANAIITTLVVS